MQDSSKERRRFPRYNCELKALINLGESWETTECLNISGGGICFSTRLRPALDNTIKIHIDNFGRFEGIVLRHMKDGFAVQLNASEFIMQQLAEQLSCELVD
ncbi:PilZ domain-containing protein [Kiloniella sp.]|uniref:PilZ domain-containing protein n=1 Tax=Kiloniella sp. TaxID=1938587 RepID=UPI003B026422